MPKFGWSTLIRRDAFIDKILRRLYISLYNGNVHV